MRKSLSLIVVAGALMALGACNTTTEQKAGAGAVAGAVAGHVQKDAEKPHN